MKIYDISQEVFNCKVYPGDPAPKKNMISKIAPYGLKVLGNGKLEKNLTVKANKFSETAIQKITKAGGKAEVL